MADTIPAYVRGPIAIPGPVRDRLLQPFSRDVLITALNRALAPQLADGEFEFLRGRTLAVNMTDLDIQWWFTTNNAGDRFAKSVNPAHATIHADSIALLLVAARRLDPDTLFFQRRLMVSGDTELGLQVKNLLDTLELEDLPTPLRRLLEQAGWMAEHWSTAGR